tara:strand:- start:1065 stop:1229 length:165 start_codon:yes stop_codon:yes gene_type:complete
LKKDCLCRKVDIDLGVIFDGFIAIKAQPVIMEFTSSNQIHFSIPDITNIYFAIK